MGLEHKFEIDAAIVRTVKSERKIDHSILIGEVIKRLRHRFKPNIKVIKGRIEYLIEEKYLERHSKYRYIYHYLV